MSHAESCVRRIEYYGVSTEGCEAMFPSGGHYIMVLLHAWSYGSLILSNLNLERFSYVVIVNQ